MLTTKEAAVRLGIDPKSVLMLIHRGRIKAERPGWAFAIPEAEVERYLRERRPAHRPKKHDKP